MPPTAPTAPIALLPAVFLFIAAAGLIAVAGARLARVSDALADATGWGEAMFGAVLLGASTSLPGIVTSVTAATRNHPELAFSNAIGGIAAQTVFLAIADMLHRRANLEHAAASVANMMQGTLLIVLLAAVLLLIAGPSATFFHLHPGSLGLILIYVFGMRMIGRARNAATWRAAPTSETVWGDEDRSASFPPQRRIGLWMHFAFLGAVAVVAGYIVAKLGLMIASRAGLSETVVGYLFTAVATSLPELVTSLAAVRHGALTLAVGNIIGGNSFDVLFVAFSDAAYLDGSIYGAVSERQVFVIALAIVLNGVLLLGLLRREKHGIANIGFESVLIILVYAGGTALLVWRP